MRSAQSTTITLIGTIAYLWIFGLPVQARAQDDDTETSQTLPEEERKGETVKRDGILQIFQIEWADATKLATVVSKFLHARAALSGESGGHKGTLETKIITDAHTNRLIVQTTVEQDLEDIRMLVKEFDVPVYQNRLKTRIYQVKHSRADELAVVLQDLIHTGRAPRARSGRTSSRRGVSNRSRTPSPSASRQAAGAPQNVTTPYIVPYLPTNCLLIQAGPEDYKEILNILGEIDAKRRQVFIEAVIVQVGLSSDLNHTIELLAGKPDAEKIRLLSSSTSGQKDPASVAPGAFLTIMQNGDVPALVQFLKNHQDSQILATPFILANDNEENQIEILETRFVQNTTVQSNQTTLSSQQGESAGITLSMVPTISDSQKTVLLEMALTVSEFGEDNPATNTLPPKIEASVTSSMTIPDGQIFVIGGLTRTGRSEAEAADKNNLYVFFCAHILTERPRK